MASQLNGYNKGLLNLSSGFDSLWGYLQLGQKMKITKVSLEEIMSSYDDPNLQQAAVAFVGALRNFDKTENDEYLYMMDDIADEVSEKIPYDEVNFMGEWTSEKSFVLLVTVMKMARLGYLPSIDLKDI